MYKKILKLFMILSLLIQYHSCKPKSEEKIETRVKEEITQPKKSKGEFPDFSIQIVLTEKAQKKMKKSKETVIVSFEFGNEIGPDGDSFMDEVELGDTLLVSTKSMKLEPAKFSQLKSDYEVLVNAFSGSKSSEYNILSCDMIHDKINVIKGKTHEIKCDLIQ
jgi:hypothetical protein